MGSARVPVLATLLTATLAGGATACGGAGSGPPPAGGDALVVYSSLPLSGPDARAAAALRNGIRLALADAGGRAGRFRVRYRSLDDTSSPAAGFSPEAAVGNARAVARDPRAVAYLGEYEKGSEASIPVSNEGGVAQIGAADTAAGLTQAEPGARPGEPERLYPAARRTFVRVVPRDTVQAAALVAAVRAQRCTRTVLVEDGTAFGGRLRRALEPAAAAQGAELATSLAVNPRAAGFARQTRQARAAGADCVLYAGGDAGDPARVFEAFAAALPSAALLGPDRLARPAFTDARAGGLRPAVARRTRLTVSTLPPAYPPGTERFARDFRAAYGERPSPAALQGYEAMALALDAIRRSGDGSRSGVVRALFDTQDRRSLLGTYSIDEDGDTSRVDFAVCSIAGGRLLPGRIVRGTVAR